MKTTLVIDTTKAFTASVSTIPQFELGEQHALRIEATGLDTGCKLGLAAYTLAGDPLFAVHDMTWTTGVAEASFGTSTVQAVAALGERQRMEIIVGVDTYVGTAPNQTRKTIAQFKTILYRDSYAGTENPETIEQAVAAVATATAQAAIATAAAATATAAQTAAELAASQTEADAIATASDRVQTGLDRQASEGAAVQTGLDRAATAEDRRAVEEMLESVGGVSDPTKMDKLVEPEGDYVLANDSTGNAQPTTVSKDALETAIGTTLPGKIDKVISATAGNIPVLAEDGSLETSGVPLTSVAYVPSPAGISESHLASFGTAGSPTIEDSGLSIYSVSTAITQAAGAVRHDTAQALSSAAKDQANANIATGFKPSLLATYEAKALMRAALVESGQAQRLIMLSSTYVASLQIPTGTTEPTLLAPLTTVVGNSGTQYSGANTHHALYKFTHVFGNSGTIGAGVGTLRIGGYLHTTAQIPCVFADGTFSALTLTLADSSKIVIRTATTSNGREYIWLKTAYGNGSTRPVYIYDYATNEWKLLVTLQTTSTSFYPLSFGFVLGAGYANCKVYHDNINGSIVYPGTIDISDIF